MTADVIQPSLKRRTIEFGERNLVLSGSHGYPTTLQTPETVAGHTPGASGRIFSILYRQAGSSTNRRALVEFSQEWVSLVLKPKTRHPRPTSVFDMPPLDLGQVLREPNPEDDLLDEMLDDTRF